MEHRLGVRLIERSTRQVKLTESGAQLVQRLEAAMTQIREAEQEAALGASEVRGTLRLSLPGAMGRLWLAPLLPEFLGLHPGVSMTVDFSDRYVDLIADGIDAAVRIGELHDSRLIATALCGNRRILCASPAYLARYGTPQSPADLVQHNCLSFTGFADFPEWRLTNGHRQERVAVRGSLSTNESEALLAAARAGLGILCAGEWLQHADVRSRSLQHILPDWQLDAPGSVYLVRPSARFASATSRAFKAWIEAKFQAGPLWHQAPA